MKKEDKELSRKAVRQRIEELFAEAEKAKGNISVSDRYVGKARRLAKKHRIRLGVLKKRFCRHCGRFWIPGRTVRVRLQKSKVVYYCLNCRHYARHPYIREQKEKRKRTATTTAAIKR